MKSIKNIFNHDSGLKYKLFIFFILYLVSTLAIWQKYQFKPSSMINFGKEFVLQNVDDVPNGAVVMQGYEGDLGNGYDGQIFYFFSRPISRFSTDWPVGFDESYRAPRIGYPFLIALFGFFGKSFAVFGMYFVNIFLFTVSFFLLRKLLKKENYYLSIFYILSPFSLGSYSVLVSDSVMVSLVIIAYFFFPKGKFYFIYPYRKSCNFNERTCVIFFLPSWLKGIFKKRMEKIIHYYRDSTHPNCMAYIFEIYISSLEGNQIN